MTIKETAKLTLAFVTVLTIIFLVVGIGMYIQGDAWALSGFIQAYFVTSIFIMLFIPLIVWIAELLNL